MSSPEMWRSVDLVKNRRFGKSVASETSLLSRTMQRYISEDGTLHSHRYESLKSCKIR
jgi:hypothetical protein